jgi:MFS family permease
VYTRAFVLTAVANFLVFGLLNAYNLLPLYIQQLGGAEGQIGRIMACYHVAAILCQAAAGGLLDRWPRRPVILAATTTLVAVAVAFALTTSLGWHFYFLRFLQGAALALYGTINLTLIADLAPPGRRAEAVGIYGVSGLAAVALAPAAGEQLLRTGGFPLFLWAAVGLAATALVVSWLTPVPAAPVAAASGRVSPRDWLALTPILLPAFQYGLANTILFFFLPPFGRLVGLSRVGPFYAAYTAAAILVRVVGGRLADRHGPRWVILPSLIVQTLGLFLVSGLHATWLLVLVGVLNGTAQGFVFPAASAMAFEAAPGGRRAQTMAVFNIAVLLGGVLGATGFGSLAETIGYRPSFTVAGLALSIGSLLFWWSFREGSPGGERRGRAA